MTIQWFPGHMAKAKREVEANLKLVDFVVELVDARAPYSSQNPMLHQVLQNKKKMVVLMKKDLADDKLTNQWITYYREQDITAIAIDVNQKKDIKEVIQTGKDMGKETLDKLKRKGIRPRPVRAMIIGIPNVGKSTLINRFANKKTAKIGDKPGVTKGQAWIKVKDNFDLLDTPGILWPKFEEEIVGYRLAAIGTIKDEVLALQDIAEFVLSFMQQHYPEYLNERYGAEISKLEDMSEVVNIIGKQRGALESGGQVDPEKVADLVIRDLRAGRLGQITLESPENK